MAKQITDYVNEILNEKRLIDMRNAIAQGISLAYEDGIKGGNANMEVSMARGVYDRLKDRLDASDSELSSATAQLAQKVGLGKKAELEDLSADVLSAIEGGEGTEFNLLSVPQDKSVSPIKTDFLEESNNLFNMFTAQTNTSIDANGNVITEQGRMLSEFIDVHPGETLQCTPAANFRYAQYTADGVFLRRLSKAEGISSITISNDAYRLKISPVVGGALGKVQTFMLNRGSELLPFEPYWFKVKDNIGFDKPKQEILPEDASFFETSKNLFNKFTAQTGLSMDTNGNAFHDHERALSTLIPVKSGDVLSCTETPLRYAFYAKGGLFIERFSTTTNQIVVPQGVSFVAVSPYLSVMNAFMLNRGSELLPFEPYWFKFKDNIGFKPTDGGGSAISTKQYAPLPAKPAHRIVRTGLNATIFAVDQQRMYLASNVAVFFTDNEGTPNTRIWMRPDGESTRVIDGAWRLANGRIMFSYGHNDTGYELYLSNDAPDEDKVFAKVLDMPSGRPMHKFGFDSHDNIVVVCEYRSMTATNGARRAWLSADYGSTWRQIFEGPERIDFHTHDICYDPYDHVVWIASGDSFSSNNGANLYYSYDWTEENPTWHQFYTDEPMAARYQYTAVAATPNRILLGSDKSPNGVHYIVKKDVRNGERYAHDDIKIGYKVDSKTSTSVLFSGFASDGQSWYCSSSQANPGETTPASVVGTKDGVNFFEIYRHPESLNLSGSGFRNIIYHDGKLYMQFTRGTTTSEGSHDVFILDKPDWVEY